MTVIDDTLPMPDLTHARVVIPAPGDGPGNWAGAPTAIVVDDTFWLAYRTRRPLLEGRGVSTVVARSGDGEVFETVCEVHRDDFGAASFERPALVHLPDGGWRLYLSCATPNSKHWWIEALDASSPQSLPTGRRTLTLPGSAATAVKDPVITLRNRDDAAAMGEADEPWELWLCCHPLDLAGEEDRMSTRRMTSADGLSWRDRGDVLTGTAGRWDARGARVSTVLSRQPLTVLYDGRADAASNWHEATGLAVGDADRLAGVSDRAPLRSAHGDGALRYVCAVPLPGGRTRFYLEAARPDGAHDLLTCLAG